jgi:hypothetical protein
MAKSSFHSKKYWLRSAEFIAIFKPCFDSLRLKNVTVMKKNVRNCRAWDVDTVWE